MGENLGTNKEQISIFVCKTKNLCIQIRFLCRLHRRCSGRGSKMFFLSLEMENFNMSYREKKKEEVPKFPQHRIGALFHGGSLWLNWFLYYSS